MGHLSRELGKQLEDSIITKLTILRQQGIVPWFQKNEPTFRKRGGFYQPTIASGADFAGIFCNGFAWTMEAKSTGMDAQTGRLGEFVREERIPATQAAHLDATVRAGALALMVLQFRPSNEPWSLFAIPWVEVPWRKHRVRHFVTPEDLGAFKMPAHTMILDEFFSRSPDGQILIRTASAIR